MKVRQLIDKKEDFPASRPEHPLIKLNELRILSAAQPLTLAINLVVYPGQLHLVQGAIGTGKSLLAEIIADITRPGIYFSGELFRSPTCKVVSLRSQDPRLAALATDRVGTILTKPPAQTATEFQSRLFKDWALDYSRIRKLRLMDLSHSEKLSLLSAQVLSEPADLIVFDGFAEELEPWARRQLKVQLLRKQAEGTALLICSRRALGKGLSPSGTTNLNSTEESSGEFMALVSPLASKSKVPEPKNVLLEVDRLRIQRGRRSPFSRKAAAKPVDGASIYLRHQEIFAVLGPSGAGKTQLLEAIAGLHRPFSGRVILNGRDVTFARGRRLQRLRQTVQIVFQEATAVLEKDLRVREFLEESLKISGDKSRNVERELSRLGLPLRLLNAWADQLSPGEAQLVDVCRRLILKPELLLIDEPRVAGIDVDGGLLSGILRSFLNSKRSILLATSDPNVARYADRVGVLIGGRIVELGAMRQVLDTPSHPATKAFLKGEGLPLSDPRDHVVGCSYASFCERQEFPRCQEKEPALAPHPSRKMTSSRQRVACFHPFD